MESALPQDGIRELRQCRAVCVGHEPGRPAPQRAHPEAGPPHAPFVASGNRHAPLRLGPCGMPFALCTVTDTGDVPS